MLRHVTTRHVVRVVSRRACLNLADNEKLVEKNEVDMSTPVHAVATPLNTCRVSRALAPVATCVLRRVARQARHVSSCHVTSRLFPMPKCMG